MATNCCSTAASARRLSDLLNEQQEPFLLHHLLLQDHDDDSATPATARRSLLRGSTACVTKLALRWADDLLAGCFPCAATRQRFCRLPRPDSDIASAGADYFDGDGGGGRAVDCGRQQLSPVSVLDLHSDDESSHHRDEHGDDDGTGEPSTSGTGTGTSLSPSPPSIHDHDLPGMTPAMEVERFQGKSVASTWDWETALVDVFRIPSLVELDLSGSPRDDWRRLVGGGREEEAWQVVRSIEAMIFEEVRWEAVRDMLSTRHNTDSSYVCYLSEF